MCSLRFDIKENTIIEDFALLRSHTVAVTGPHCTALSILRQVLCLDL
jgi:hypothetical protein